MRGTSQGDDKVTSPDVSRRLHEVAASEDKELRIIDGAFHAEVFFNPDDDVATESYAYVASWLEMRTTAS